MSEYLIRAEYSTALTIFFVIVVRNNPIKIVFLSNIFINIYLVYVSRIS